MNDQQFMQMLEVMKQAFQKPEGHEGKGKCFMDGRKFARVEVFAGDEKKWKEWDFNFQVVVSSANHYMGEFLRQRKT